MAVPYTFGSATSAIPLSQLDSNFATTITLGNTAIQLGNTVTTLNNMTLNNVTITSSTVNGLTLTNATLTNANITSVSATFPNNFLANSSVTLGNTALTLGSTVTAIGNLTISNATVSNALVDSVSIAGYMGVPQNSQNGNYNIVLADAGKHIYHPIGQAAATYTIPANSNVAFTTGTAITIVNGSANNVSIAITTDTMTLANSATTGTRTLTANGVATCVKVTSTSWIISGAGLS